MREPVGLSLHWGGITLGAVAQHEVAGADRVEIGGYFNLDNVYNRERQYDKAIEAYRRALEITPHSAMVLYVGLQN